MSYAGTQKECPTVSEVKVSAGCLVGGIGGLEKWEPREAFELLTIDLSRPTATKEGVTESTYVALQQVVATSAGETLS